jgi:excisionase family DNA binding protein
VTIREPRLETEQLLTIDEVAEVLRVSVRTMRRLVACRSLPFIRVGRLVRFRPEDVRRFLEGRRYA